MSEEKQYTSYLLRLWQVQSKGQWVWRASLEDSRSGERQGFASVEALLAFLREMTDVAAHTSEGESPIGA